MITLSDNDLRQLLLYYQSTVHYHPERVLIKTNKRLYDRLFITRMTVDKLMKRPDVQRAMGITKKNSHNEPD